MWFERRITHHQGGEIGRQTEAVVAAVAVVGLRGEGVEEEGKPGCGSQRWGWTGRRAEGVEGGMLDGGLVGGVEASERTAHETKGGVVGVGVARSFSEKTFPSLFRGPEFLLFTVGAPPHPTDPTPHSAHFNALQTPWDLDLDVYTALPSLFFPAPFPAVTGVYKCPGSLLHLHHPFLLLSNPPCHHGCTPAPTAAHTE